MPKKTPYKNETHFYETLSPAMPYRAATYEGHAREGTHMWVYPAWIAGSVVLGVLLGLAIKDFQWVHPASLKPGLVATMSNAPIAVTGFKLVQAQSQPIQGNQTSLQAPTDSSGQVNSSNLITGLQGSVGTAAVR